MAQAQQERIPWVPCYNQGVVLCGPGGQLKPQIAYFVGQATQRVFGAIMMRRAIALVLSCAALSGCGAIPSTPNFSLPSVKMPSFSGPRAGHAGACDIGSAGGRGELRQGQLHYALHADRAERHGDL